MSKSNKAEITRRVRTVAEYLIQGYSASDIVRNVTVTWDIKERQAENYISKAYKLIHDEAVKSIADSKAFHLKARLDLYRDLMKERSKVLKGDTDQKSKVWMLTQLESKIMDILKDMARIDGLYVERLEHSGPEGQPLFTQPIQIIFQHNEAHIEPISSEAQLQKLLDQAEQMDLERLQSKQVKEHNSNRDGHASDPT